jgi:hypothetical protein
MEPSHAYTGTCMAAWRSLHIHIQAGSHNCKICHNQLNGEGSYLWEFLDVKLFTMPKWILDKRQQNLITGYTERIIGVSFQFNWIHINKISLTSGRPGLQGKSFVAGSFRAVAVGPTPLLPMGCTVAKSLVTSIAHYFCNCLQTTIAKEIASRSPAPQFWVYLIHKMKHKLCLSVFFYLSKKT